MPINKQDISEDSEILSLFKQEGQEERAYSIILRKYRERLYWHIRGMVASHDDTDDILQTVFIKVWKYLPDFREESKLYTWLYRIATNEAISFLKQQRISYRMPFEFLKKHSNSYIDDPYFNGDNLQLALHREIMKLPPKQRAVFNLRYFQEMKYEEISNILNTSEGALKASYHHAYQKIKKNLENIF